MALGTKRAILADLDGVFFKLVDHFGEYGVSARLLHEIKIVDGLGDTLDALVKHGFIIIGHTNQPDIAREKITQEFLDEKHALLFKKYPQIRKIFICAHTETDLCDCRKPKPGLLRQAAKEFEIALNAARESKMPGIYLTAHVGALAGQNLSHLHWHIVRYNLDESNNDADVAREWHNLYFDSERSWVLKRSDLTIYRNELFTAVIDGIRAGQCLILPHDIRNADMWDMLLSECGDPGRYFFADALHNIISLYNEKFLSPQGFAPDFNASVVLGEFGSILYAQYTPILNHWGSAEQAALYTKCPITLPWPHEMTAAYLRGEITV